MPFLDKIRSLRRVKAADLIPNPKNFRTHDEGQRTAIRSVLDSVGFAGAVLARPVEGGLMLIDGHLRADVAGDAKVPVLVLDVTEEEADLILATHDAIGMMADEDTDRLNSLLDSIKSEGMELDDVLDLFREGEVLEIEGAGEQYEADEKMKFRGWSLPIGPEAAELLNTKLTAYMDEHATCLGIGEQMLQVLEN